MSLFNIDVYSESTYTNKIISKLVGAEQLIWIQETIIIILCDYNIIALLMYTAKIEIVENGEHLLAHMEIIISVLMVSVKIRIKSCLFFSYRT